MTKTETHKENGAKGNTCWVPCEQCDNDTEHEVCVSVDTSDYSHESDIHVGGSFQVVRCCGCRWLSFRQTWWSSEDLDERGEAEEHEELYPGRLRGSKPIRADYYLPVKVRRIYREAHFALTNKQTILAGIGIRALVEAVCSEEHATGGNLEKKIDSLVDLGKLTHAGADILHGTRLLGNKAAHEVEPPTEDDVIAAMRVAEHLLETVYILPRTAEALPKRKKVAAKKKAASKKKVASELAAAKAKVIANEKKKKTTPDRVK